MKRQQYSIRGIKRRTGEVIEGTTSWDGLASIYAVTTNDDGTAYLSELDAITEFEEVPSR